MKITVWDTDAKRANAICCNLRRSQPKCGEELELEIQSEPPLVARSGLMDKMPTLEIDGVFWTWKIGECISEHACCLLFEHIKETLIKSQKFNRHPLLFVL